MRREGNIAPWRPAVSRHEFALCSVYLPVGRIPARRQWRRARGRGELQRGRLRLYLGGFCIYCATCTTKTWQLNLHFIKGKSHIHVWFMVKYCDSETCRVVAWLVKVLVSPAGCHRFVSQQCVKCWANSLFNYLPCMHSYSLSTKLRIGLIVLFLQR